MNKAGKFFAYIAALAMIAFVTWLLWVFVTSINDVNTSIKAGLIGIFGAFALGGLAHYQTKKREIEARHFADKREGYMHIINLIFDFVFSAEKKENYRYAT